MARIKYYNPGTKKWEYADSCYATVTGDYATEEYVINAVSESLSMFKNGSAGQFAVSDGNGGIAWLTIVNGEDGEF